MIYEVQINMTGGNFRSGQIANCLPMGSIKWGTHDKIPPLKVIEVDESELPQRVKNFPPGTWNQIMRRDYRFLNGRFVPRPQNELNKRKRPGDLYQ